MDRPDGSQPLPASLSRRLLDGWLSCACALIVAAGCATNDPDPDDGTPPADTAAGGANSASGGAGGDMLDDMLDDDMSDDDAPADDDDTPDAATPMPSSTAPVMDPPTPDAGVDPPAPTGCDELDEGDVVCDGFGGTTRSVCRAGQIVATTPCTSGDICNPDTGMCELPATECIGRSPGEVYCSGVQRIACAPSLLSVETETCSSSAHCQAGAGASCAVCLEGAFSCVDNQLHECSPGEGWVATDDPPCTPAAPCNRDTGTCTALVCLPGQRRCEGDSLQECNADQSAFTQIEMCDPGLCDPVNFECDTCAAGDAECAANGSDKLICASDGQSAETQACASETPHCRGSGECVECTSDSHCSAPECYTPTCNLGAGSCSMGPAAEGIDCSTGVCDGAGNCVECNDASQCTASGECYRPTCTDGTCGQTGNTGMACGGGNNLCSGSGDCLSCPEWDDFDGDSFWRPELKDPRWSQATVIPLLYDVNGPTGSGVSNSVVRVLEDDRYMYVAFEIMLDANGPTINDFVYVAFTQGGADGAYALALRMRANDAPIAAPVDPDGAGPIVVNADVDAPHTVQPNSVVWWETVDANGPAAPEWTVNTGVPEWLTAARWDRATAANPRWAMTIRIDLAAIASTDDRKMFFGTNVDEGSPDDIVLGNVQPVAEADEASSVGMTTPMPGMSTTWVPIQPATCVSAGQ